MTLSCRYAKIRACEDLKQGELPEVRLLKYLKKDTVKEVIDRAVACKNQAGKKQNPGISAKIKGALGAKSAEEKVFHRYLKELKNSEAAELTALMWLGRDSERNPEFWGDLVREATRDGLKSLTEAPAELLPKYLRTGMERLARLTINRRKQPNRRREELRKIVIGSLTLKAYQDRYGQEKGMEQLVLMLDNKGFLDQPQDRELFREFLPQPEESLDTVIANTVNAAPTS